jgi:hypothetical protein
VQKGVRGEAAMFFGFRLSLWASEICDLEWWRDVHFASAFGRSERDLPGHSHQPFF